LKGGYFWKEWEGLLPPFLWKCGRCGREFTDEEYEHLPEVSLSSGDHLHKCRSCGYLFGVETWKMESLAKVKVPEVEFETKISTQFLEATIRSSATRPV